MITILPVDQVDILRFDTFCQVKGLGPGDFFILNTSLNPMDKKVQKASIIGFSTNLQPMDDSHRTGYVKTVWDRHFHLVPGSNCNN